jgi:diguanylate cyclase (GGDEF) domain
MSLFRKLVLSTSILMFLMLSATFVVVMHAERQLLAHQLREDASIAALNLATRLRGALAPDERDQREQWVDELFHGGEYRRVVFHDLADNTAIYRTHTLEGLDTPEWFVNTFALADGFGAASVKVVGAVQGRVFVSKHPARAYATLWWHFLLNMWLFLGVALMVYALILVFAAWHFRGLRRLQGQAKNVLRGNYGQVMDITCASDVNTLAVTINWLTAKLRNILSEQLMISQSLHTEAHLDPLTGLPNRNAFEAQMHAWVSADGGGPGVLLLLHVAGVYELNDSHGRDAGDSLLRRVAELMRDSLATWPGGFASRRTGCDFAVFVPGMAQEEAAHWLSGIKVRVESIELAVNSEMVNFWLGAAASRAITSMAKMLSAADAALRLARSSGRTDWAVYPVDDPLIDVRPAGEWQQFLKRMIERKEVLLHFQPMYSRALEPMGSEVF